MSRKNKIEYGKYIFQDDDFKSGNMFLATSLLASQLQTNAFEATVRCTDPAILEFERNSKLTYFYDDNQRGIFYVQSIKRVGPELYAISATSTLGLLSEGQHYGGIYTGQTAREVIADICGTVPFAVKSNLEGIKLYGWLPIATPRDNLAQVLFAIGAALKTDLDGVLRIEGLWDGVSGTVTRDDMYAEAAVDYDGKVTQVIVNEHQYVPWTEEKQLFEGTAQAGDVITFDEPMHSLKADGFTIQARGANWARVSAGTGVLSGKTYIHNTRQISKDVWPAREPNVKTVKEATLVSLVNSQACAQRLADYYRCRERVDAPVVYHGELPGDRLATYHPFDKTGVAACLESADITLSNTLKAQEKSLVGFVPKQIEAVEIFDTQEIISESIEWEVPYGVTHIRAVLISGGQGGGAGHNGETGTSGTSVHISSGQTGSYTGQSGNGGDGGDPGIPGLGGNVYIIDVDVSQGQKFIINIGQGGKGGASDGESGSLGGATTIQIGDKIYSSSDGSSGSGYLDITTGISYANRGKTGTKGAKGGKGRRMSEIAESGEDSINSTGGAVGENSFNSYRKTGIGSTPSVTQNWKRGEKNSSGGPITVKPNYSISSIGRVTTSGTDFSMGSSSLEEGSGRVGYKSQNVSITPSYENNSVTNYLTQYYYVYDSYYKNYDRYRKACDVNVVYPKYNVTVYYGAYAGGGGGAALGSNGGDATTKGGKGADATAPSNATVFGAGGDAGNGGGGGGGGGAGAAEASGTPGNLSYSSTGYGGDGGAPGLGSHGADGAKGCLILYFGVPKIVQHGQLVDKHNKMILDRLGRRIIV